MRLRASPLRPFRDLLMLWDAREPGTVVTATGFVPSPITLPSGLLPNGVSPAGVFTRASTKTAVDANGRVYIVPYGLPAQHHIYNAGVWSHVGVLLERAATNLAIYTEDHSGAAWSAVGSPTRTANALRCGAVWLELLGDDAAGALEGYTQDVAFTGNGTKPYTVYFSQGSSTSSVVRWRDTTAGADRLLVAITWNAGVPTITASAGANILNTPERVAAPDGTPCWRLIACLTGVVAANTNQLQVYPATDAALATSNTGTIYLGGHMAENDPTAAARPSSYVPSLAGSQGTRAADFLTLVVDWLPRDLTIYADMYEFGSFQAAGPLRAIQLGDDDSGTASSAIIECNNIGDVSIHYYNASANQQSDNSTGAVTRHDHHEVRAAILAAGVYVGRSINGATEAVSTPATALAHPPTYAESLLCLTPNGFSGYAIKSLKIAHGEKTLAQLRAA